MKKGFTLIELLAVIVILSIIIVIAVPITGKVIKTGKLEAVEKSVEFYVKEIESKYSEWVIEGIPADIVQDKSESGYIIFSVNELNNVLKLQGTKPIDGTVKIDNGYSTNSNYFGYVVNAELEYENGYIATYIYHTESGYSGDKTEINITDK